MLRGNDMKSIKFKTMKLSDIKISSAFSDSIPKEHKMKKCRDNWNIYHRQDRWIVVDKNGYLNDGYIQYLVLRENEVEETIVKISNNRKKGCKHKEVKEVKYSDIPTYRNNATTYVYGTHPNSACDKTFCWRVPKSWCNWSDNLQIGDMIMCYTKFGIAPVVVSRVETLGECPIELRVKRVAKREIRRNGMVVEL